MDLELGYAFQEPTLLRRALTHPSASGEPGSGLDHNQRLEFLGDAVLQLILTEELYQRFPRWGEGLLTKARARLVNRHSLAALGAQLQLGRHLILSRGEERSRGRERPSALADAFEAVLGAVYVDGGYGAARTFVLRQYAAPLEELTRGPDVDNPKGELQELLQGGSLELPLYRLEQASGPDHDRDFECAVYHGGVELGRGRGKSKRAAETDAALDALARLRAAGLTAAASNNV
ncbi:MAG: ribonuclease III [Verrucomicrobia bacterium]|nr:ribonuclease III [Verrucomicrobiota bacterium]